MLLAIARSWVISAWLAMIGMFRRERPQLIAIQGFSNGARVKITTTGRSILYNTGDVVWFDNNNQVIEIKTHDGVRWRKPNA